MKKRSKRMVMDLTLKGVAQRETGRETLYYGLVFRMPADDFPDKVDEYLDEALKKVESFDPRIDDAEIGDIHELYAVCDLESDVEHPDILFMLRVPVHKK